MVSELHATGGGRLTAVYCVGADGRPLMACGRCRQLLWENGGPGCLLMTPEGVLPMSDGAAAGLRGRHLARTGADGVRGAPRPGDDGRRSSEDGHVSEAFDAVDVISAKRDRAELSDAQIDWVIDAYTRGAVAEEQMSALAMAIYLNGMSPREIARWADAMIRSGERLDFSGLSRPTSDKHSTGGVGDKITLPLAPIVAACGVAVPQLSGRGLGHTGGTLDKLESIPGWRASLTQRADARASSRTSAPSSAPPARGSPPPTRSCMRCVTSRGPCPACRSSPPRS